MSEACVLIADDHPLFRAALKQAVDQALSGAVIREADDMAGLESAVADADIDLVLLDLKMPGARGFSSLLYLRGQHPSVPVIVVSAADDPSTMRRAKDFGASGFVPKSTPLAAIRDAIAQVMAGALAFPPMDPPATQDDADLASRIGSLTPQQFRVLMMVADGLLNKQIAYELEVSEATVKAHMTAIMRKLRIYSRTQAALIAQSLDVAEIRIEGVSPEG